jgi:hypothetical protein
MNIRKIRSMTLTLCGIAFMLLSNSSYAVDMAVLQEQCADIGFKMRTPANGTCVLRLMKGVKAEEKAVAAQQQAYANQQAAQAQQAAALQQQQTQMYELQRRSVAAQEQAAQAQAEGAADERRSRSLKLMNQGLDRMTGTGAYAPKASTSFSCYRNGNHTTCN